MFCQECGTKNTDDSIFCANCGVRLERDAVNQNQTQKVQPQGYPGAGVQSMPKKIEKWKLIFGVELVMIVLLLILAYKNAGTYFGAGEVAERYFLANANGDWSRAYQMLELDESDFVKEKDYEKMAAKDSLPKITTYTVGEIDALSGKELGTTVDIRYRSKGDSMDSTYTVSLNKQPGKKFLLFDDWKVSTDDIIAKDVTVRVPQDAKVILDGEKLSDSYLSKREDEEEHLDTYVVPQMFAGTHAVTVTMDGMKEDHGTLNTYNADSYTVYSLNPTEETMDKIIKTAGEDMQKVYEAAMHGDAFSTIADLYVSDKDEMERIEDNYDTFLEAVQRNSRNTVNTLRISNISASAENYGWSDEMVMEVRLEFDYSVDFSYEDFWDGDIKQDSYDSSDSITYEFVYEDGEWLPRNLGCHTLYYY